jgi:P4 family phage/plasmid primase-like protien
MNGNGNGDSDGEWDVGITRRTEKSKVRLTGNRAKKAEKGIGGGPTARLVSVFERLVGSPIKCRGKEWYLYNGIKWELQENGRDTFRNEAWKAQSIDNRNDVRARRILDSVEYVRQLARGEKFYGAIRWILGEQYYLVNFCNGVMKIDATTGVFCEKLIEHSPEYMFTASLGNYTSKLYECPEFLYRLRDILDRKRDRDLLLDFFASALLPDSRFEVCLFCIGKGGNGKSILTETLAAAIGNDVSSALTFHQICANDRKHLYRLKEKLINVSTETENRMVTENSTFKRIVSGEAFETDKLYASGFKMQTNCKLCFLTNNLPEFKYGTQAENRRIRFIHFEKCYEGKAKDLLLKRRLSIELDGILSMLVRRLPRLCKLAEMGRGGILSRRQLKYFSDRNSIIESFFADCTEICSKSFSRDRSTIYRCFERYCTSHEEDVRLTSSQFYRQLKKMHPELDMNYKLRNGRVSSSYGIKGITLTKLGRQLLEDNSRRGGKYSNLF